MSKSRYELKTGDKFNKLTYIRDSSLKYKYDRIGVWRCDCGVENNIINYAVRSGNTKSCGCLHTIQIGKRYGSLVFEGYSGSSYGSNKKGFWRCDCGNVFEAINNNVKGKSVVMCKNCSVAAAGVAKRKHNCSNGKSKLYHIWVSMKQRCYNQNNVEYKRYGARGIKVCERWINSFENFREDMGERPSDNHSIDRIDVNGDYTPDNCRWATDTEQCNNKRSNRRYEFNGITKTTAEWGRYFGLSNASNITTLIKKRGVECAFEYYYSKMEATH
jgi:hypothetical protein